MSDPVSALNHARFGGIAQIEECGLVGMITLRGDLSARALKSAATAAAGSDMPAPMGITGSLEGGLAWMSPDELLCLCPYTEVTARLDKMTGSLSKTHSLAVNVSDARAVFRVSGAVSRDVMAKLCPVDLSPAAFGPGQMRRTRMAQVPAAIWMSDDETFHVICFRSVADYVFGILKVAAQKGSEVRFF